MHPVDTHCHLNQSPLCHDAAGVLERAAVRAAALRTVAIGAIGLDAKITTSGLAQQLPLFESQPALAGGNGIH